MSEQVAAHSTSHASRCSHEASVMPCASRCILMYCRLTLRSYHAEMWRGSTVPMNSVSHSITASPLRRPWHALWASCAPATLGSRPMYSILPSVAWQRSWDCCCSCAWG
jgi:hypothetical protein